MTFLARELSALAYGNGFTLWHYRTRDLAADIDDAGYFNAASGMVRSGDFIFVNAGEATAPIHGVVVVTSNKNGVVDVSNLTSFGAVNTD
jgi:hypothetical protein